MIKKNIKNYLIFLKNKFKNKKKFIQKSSIHNNNLHLKKIIFLNFKQNFIKKNKISQILMNNRSVKKKIYLNRWETNSLFNNNKLINFRRWQK